MVIVIGLAEQRIMQLRKLRNWSQRELADHANMSQSKISRIESERVSPTTQELERLAQAFGIKTMEFLDESIQEFTIEIRRE